MEELSFLENTKLDKDSLEKLSNKINQLNELRKQIQEKEEEVKRLKKWEKVLSGEEIPTYLAQFGISEIKLDSGEKVSIKEDVSVTIPKQDHIKREKVFRWLSANGGAGIIKDQLIVQEPEKEIMDLVKELSLVYERNKSVNTNSLKAYFREVLGMKKSLAKFTPEEIPAVFNLYLYKQTNIK